MKKLLVFLASLSIGTTLLITGCHTVQGAGQDLQAGGKAISHTAQKTSEALSGNNKD